MMIRDSTPEDVPAMLQLTREFFTDDEVACVQDILEVFLHKEGQRDYVLLTAVQDGAVIGYACYGPTAITEGNYSLFWMCVGGEKRNHGVGSALLAEIEARLAGSGRLLLAETSSTQGYAAARAFYRKHGLIEWTTIPDFYRLGDGLVLYVKYLDRTTSPPPQPTR